MKIENKKNELEPQEEIGEDVFGIETYESSFSIKVHKLLDKYYSFKKSKMFIPTAVLAGFAFFVLIVLIGFSTGNGVSAIKGIEIKAPKIMYLGTSEKFFVDVYGQGELSETKIDFSVSNDTVATLKDQTLIGGSVSNVVTPKKIGRFNIDVQAKYKNSKKKTSSSSIVVCKKLGVGTFLNYTMTLKEGKTMYLNFDVGKEKECYSNIKYEIEDKTIVFMNGERTFKGIKKGETKVTLKSGIYETSFIIKVQ